MSKCTRSGRLHIDELAILHLNRMIETLVKENPHLDISSSKVASLILCDYSEKYFSRSQKKLSERLFDKKRYIKHLLSTTDSPEELIRQVSLLKGITKKQPPHGSGNTSPETLSKTPIDEETDV